MVLGITPSTKFVYSLKLPTPYRYGKFLLLYVITLSMARFCYFTRTFFGEEYAPYTLPLFVLIYARTFT